MLTWSMHLIIFVNNAMSQAHGFVSLIIVTLIIIIKNKHVAVIINVKTCAWYQSKQQNHVLTLIITNNNHVTVIINAKPCAWLMALLTKIMRCILQVRAQEQPHPWLVGI